MTFEDYFKLPEFQQHPQAERYKKALIGKFPREILGGMLQFTPDTADRWAGPYPASCARFTLGLWDYKVSFAEAREHALVNLAKRLKVKSKGAGRYKDLVARILDGESLAVHQACEWGDSDHPWRIWVLGNDDTSYSKWFTAEQEAKNFLQMLEAAEPLDFHKDFMPFGWVFTN